MRLKSGSRSCINITHSITCAPAISGSMPSVLVVCFAKSIQVIVLSCWSLIGFLLLLDTYFRFVLVLHLSAHMELVGRSWLSVSWFDELHHVSRCAPRVSSQLSSSQTSVATCDIRKILQQLDLLVKEL